MILSSFAPPKRTHLGFFMCLEMVSKSMKQLVSFVSFGSRYVFLLAGMVCAIDINEGRLRILEETAKLHEVDDVISPVHSDLRMFVVG